MATKLQEGEVLLAIGNEDAGGAVYKKIFCILHWKKRIGGAGVLTYGSNVKSDYTSRGGIGDAGIIYSTDATARNWIVDSHQRNGRTDCISRRCFEKQSA